MTAQLEPEFQLRLNGSRHANLSAAFSLELDGQVAGFRSRAGQVQILSEPQAVHRRLPRWVLTRLYLGYYAGQEVLEMGGLPWDRSDGMVPDDLELDNTPLTLPEAEAALFATLFPKLWPTSWPDTDVWAWILGQKHPRYYFNHRRVLKQPARDKIEYSPFPWLEAVIRVAWRACPELVEGRRSRSPRRKTPDINGHLCIPDAPGSCRYN